jgi:hypothetical protein
MWCLTLESMSRQTPIVEHLGGLPPLPRLPQSTSNFNVPPAF